MDVTRRGWMGVAGLLLGLGATAFAAEGSSTPDLLRRTQLAEPNSLAVLDIRSPADYTASHIQGALNVPSESLSAWQGPLDKPVVVYCPANCPSGKQAVDALKARGFSDVRPLHPGRASQGRIRRRPHPRRRQHTLGRAGTSADGIAQGRARLRPPTSAQPQSGGTGAGRHRAQGRAGRLGEAQIRAGGQIT
ncbi:MAG: hypothetical protein FD126_3752 [Elusimicrobia bacterium]|nr:MAG: hypothetical protein FD126_3752 [Elusimicrobiota bacterium]